MKSPERIWASSVTENYGEWQTSTDGLPRPTEYIRSDLVAELAVTDAMIEAAWEAWQTGDLEYGPEAMRSALKAAMEAGLVSDHSHDHNT